MRAARAGNLVALRAALEREARAGELDNHEARAVAEAVAAVEIARARGRDGAGLISTLSPCARSLDDALDRRHHHGVDDESAAAAAMVLLEARELDADDAEELATKHGGSVAKRSGEPVATAWRAVGARGLVRERDGTARRKLFVDGDQEVRAAALRAAGDARDAADADAVLEAARLEPNPLGRTTAIRAAGIIGGEHVVLALKDLWAAADEPIRIAIADAWGRPRSAAAGGRRELGLAVQGIQGAPAIVAANALTKLSAPDGGAEALGLLTRAIETGSARNRIYVIGMAPLRVAAVRAAVLRASSDKDEPVAVAALARLVETPASAGGFAVGSREREAAIARLLAVANGSSAQALFAKEALGRAKVRGAISMLERDLRSPDVRVRESAAKALISAGELARAVVVVADPQQRTRVNIACGIVAEADR